MVDKLERYNAGDTSDVIEATEYEKTIENDENQGQQFANEEADDLKKKAAQAAADNYASRNQENKQNKQFSPEEAEELRKKATQAAADNYARREQENTEKMRLTLQEQQQLRARVLGRQDAVDGSGSTIHLANGKKIIEANVKIGGVEREFIGYKNRFRKMDEDTALTIVLTAKEKGWDSIDVQGSKKSKDMLAKVAIEHGLTVSNHVPPEVKVESKFAQGEMKQNVSPEPVVNQPSGQSNQSRLLQGSKAGTPNTSRYTVKQLPVQPEVKKLPAPPKDTGQKKLASPAM